MAHQNFLQDPTTAAMMGQNPQAQSIMGALQAHMAEHFGFKYRQQIEQELGAPLPYLKDGQDQEDIPEEYEVQLSRLVAQASSQLLQKHQQEQAQQQAQQQAEDPIIQMQKQELEIKSQDQQRRAAKDQADIALENRRLDIEEQRTQGQLEIEGTKMGIKMEHDKTTLDRKSELDATKIGIDMEDKVTQRRISKAQIAAQVLSQMSNKGKK
jgi:hypothetical protein